MSVQRPKNVVVLPASVPPALTQVRSDRDRGRWTEAQKEGRDKERQGQRGGNKERHKTKERLPKRICHL